MESTGNTAGMPYRQLHELMGAHTEALKQLDDAQASVPPAPGKWSRKEELGHLIDSAHNNLRRFIVAQYTWAPKIVYDQDAWVRTVGYQHRRSDDLIALWYQLNIQIFELLRAMPET